MRSIGVAVIAPWWAQSTPGSILQFPGRLPSAELAFVAPLAARIKDALDNTLRVWDAASGEENGVRTLSLQACQGRNCLAKATPSHCADRGAGQGRAPRAGCAGRRSLTGAAIGAGEPASRAATEPHRRLNSIWPPRRIRSGKRRPCPAMGHICAIVRHQSGLILQAN